MKKLLLIVVSMSISFGLHATINTDGIWFFISQGKYPQAINEIDYLSHNPSLTNKDHLHLSMIRYIVSSEALNFPAISDDMGTILQFANNAISERAER